MSKKRIDITREEILEARVGRTITDTAAYLSIGRTTLNNRIREFGIGEGRGRYDRSYARRKKRSLVHQRLMEHSGERLPANIGGLSEILGLTPENVRSYLERGRRSTERFFREVLNKAPKYVILEDIKKIKYPIGSFSRMSIVMDKWGRNVRLRVVLKSGISTLFKYNVKQLWDSMEAQVANKE